MVESISSVADNSVVNKIINEYGMELAEAFGKIKSVHDIANKTNLLAINASIETIHATDLLASFEKIVEENLYIQGRLMAEILMRDPDFILKDGQAVAEDYGLEEFFITDEEGSITFTNLPVWKNAKLSAPEILNILKDQKLEISQRSRVSGIGGELFKTVGVGRKDQKGIIQIGAHYSRPKGQESIDGFGVVAKEAKRLADESKALSLKISDLTNVLNNQLKEMTADLSEIRKCIKGIVSLLTDLINIARQTSLLGIRASIEAAHSSNDKQEFDNMLNIHMTVEAKLVSYLIEKADLSDEDLKELAQYSSIDEFWITDRDGVVELTNIPGGRGFAFKNEGQTAPFMKLLANPDRVVTAPPSMRALDSKVFKYVGVGRKEKSGIVQIGKASKMYGESTAKGFSVVSNQIKILAEQSRNISVEIQDIFERMDSRAQAAQQSLHSFNKEKSFVFTRF